MKVHEALSCVMDEVRAVAKTERNTHQNYNFRGIDAVVNAVAPALRNNNVLVIPRVIDVDSESVLVGRNNTPMRAVTLTVEYTFVGPEGDTLVAVSIGEAMDSGDKAVPKAMSVALRTCLLQALMLPTDEPDPDSYSYDRNTATFDPADASTWPDKVDTGMAKRILVAAFDGDKETASGAWKAMEIGDGPFGKTDLIEIIATAKVFMTEGEGKAF